MCLCLGCSCGGWCRWGIGRGLGPASGRVGWCYVCVRCEFGIFVRMTGPGNCVLCLADACASEVHPSVQSCCTLWISAF